MNSRPEFKDFFEFLEYYQNGPAGDGFVDRDYGDMFFLAVFRYCVWVLNQDLDTFGELGNWAHKIRRNQT